MRSYRFSLGHLVRSLAAGVLVAAAAAALAPEFRDPVAAVVTVLLVATTAAHVDLFGTLILRAVRQEFRVRKVLKSLRGVRDLSEVLRIVVNAPLDAAAVYTLIAALRDKDHAVRLGAAVALGRIGPDAKQAVPGRSALLKDENNAVRHAASRALQEIDAITAVTAVAR